VESSCETAEIAPSSTARPIGAVHAREPFGALLLRAIPPCTRSRGSATRQRCDRVLAVNRDGTYELPVMLTPDEDGGFVVECPVIPGCISQGDTRDEALSNIREAIELCLENQASEGWLLPRQVEIIKIAV
jgi:predicted RNase H-like HicB family nuclease